VNENTELSLEQQLDQARQLLQVLDDGLLQIDGQLCCHSVWSQQASLLGHRPQKLQETNLWDVLPSEEVTPLHEGVRYTLQHQKPTLMEFWSSIEKCWYACRITPLSVHAFPKGHVLLSLRDVTHQKAEHIAADGFPHTPQRALRIGTWKLSLPDQTLHADPALLRLLHLPPETQLLTLEDFLKLLPEGEPARLRDRLQSLQQIGQEIDEIYRVLDVDLRLRFLHLRTCTLFNQQRQPHTVVAFLADVTEQELLRIRLQEREERLQIAMDIVNLGVWDWQVELNEMFWDEFIYNIYGLPQRAAENEESFLEQIIGEDRARIRHSLQQAKQGLRDFEEMFRIRRPDGAIRYVQVRSKTFREGGSVRIVGIKRDVTPNLETDRSMLMFEQILAQNQTAMLFTNLEGRVMFLNRAAEEIFGYNYNEWLERPLNEILTDLPAFESVNKALNAEGTWEQEVRFPNKQGTWIDVHLQAGRIRDHERVDIGCAFSCRDVTQQRKMERQLITQRRFFREMLDHSPTMIFVRDEAGQLLFANRALAQRFHSTVEALQGTKLQFVPETPEAYHQIIQSTVSEAQEVRCQLPDGRSYWFHVQKCGVPFLDGSTKLLGMATDISHLKVVEAEINAMNQELEEKNRKLEATQAQLVQSAKLSSLGDMLAMIAHQWRQPLSRISTIAANEVVRLQMHADPERTKTQLEKIARHTQELSATINDFRKFFDPLRHKDSVVLTEVVHRGLQMAGESLTLAGIHVELKINAVQSVQVHVSEMIQVFLNILKNAQDVIVERQIQGGRIIVSVTENQQAQCLSIEDNAGGISEEVMSEVFLPYFTTKTKLNGTGLGLYMSKIVVEDQLNGAISVSNTEQGARFEISLPLEQRSSGVVSPSITA
jgi:PAS domain S-box-containing protein